MTYRQIQTILQRKKTSKRPFASFIDFLKKRI